MLYQPIKKKELNFSLQEILNISNNNSDVLMLLYLHFNFSKKIMSMQQWLSTHKILIYPTLDWTYYTYKEYKTKRRYSAFQVSKTNQLVYKNILKEDIDEDLKVIYLKLVSVMPPYSKDKFVPYEFVPRGVHHLVKHGLIMSTENGGVILPKERLV